MFKIGSCLILAGVIQSLISFGTMPSVFAQEGHCDPDLSRNAPADHPFKYRNRGDRCEGVYIENVRCTALLVVSFTESFEDYDLTSGRNLAVEWPVFGNREIRLRAQALRPRLYYRMDSTRRARSTSYSWTPGVLGALNIRKPEVGIIAWTQHAVGATDRSVYLPLRVGQQRRPAATGSYELMVLPCGELREVYVTLAKAGADGRPELTLKNGEPLRYGYYPGGQGINIPITNLKGTGIYHMQIGATLREGGSSTTELWFYHSRN